ncbi:hypothetical protein GFB49_15130 [Epibacterium sp. SM1979]|uniref:Uncharacterized protein n=1 Tax=Tritonibacter litoralis TaxID=2662264 RepID=A0A843YJ15_9RHOB|nr:hypothetical protein [Tritonibacter litoralis]MQQ09798.1 hypothetical protein [Tritonibacter litoralis]
MNFEQLTLSPQAATVMFCITCLAGYQYRRVWKREGPRYQYWLFGTIAALGLVTLGLIPLNVAG